MTGSHKFPGLHCYTAITLQRYNATAPAATRGKCYRSSVTVEWEVRLVSVRCPFRVRLESVGVAIYWLERARLLIRERRRATGSPLVLLLVVLDEG